jgi:hypothetical protein
MTDYPKMLSQVMTMPIHLQAGSYIAWAGAGSTEEIVWA